MTRTEQEGSKIRDKIDELYLKFYKNNRSYKKILEMSFKRIQYSEQNKDTVIATDYLKDVFNTVDFLERQKK
jgi:L-rhamnose isomerase